MSKECEDNGALIRCVMLKVKKLISEAGSGIPEAPEDGLQYGRQDGQWTEISGGSQGLNDVLAIDGIAQNKYMSIQDSAFPNDKATEFLNNLVSVSNSQEGGVQLKPAMIDLYRPLGLGSGTILGASLKLNNSTNVFSGIYEFPNKGGGTHVIATITDLDNLVHKTGSEEIAGNKTFTNIMNVVDNMNVIPSAGSYPYTSVYNYGMDVFTSATKYQRFTDNRVSWYDGANRTDLYATAPTAVRQLFLPDAPGNLTVSVNGQLTGTNGNVVLSAISGTFANPTSITVVNGVITAIS